MYKRQLHHLDPRAVALEELPGLIDRHVVGTDFLDLTDVLPRKRHKVLMLSLIHICVNFSTANRRIDGWKVV